MKSYLTNLWFALRGRSDEECRKRFNELKQRFDSQVNKLQAAISDADEKNVLNELDRVAIDNSCKSIVRYAHTVSGHTFMSLTDQNIRDSLTSLGLDILVHHTKKESV